MLFWFVYFVSGILLFEFIWGMAQGGETGISWHLALLHITSHTVSIQALIWIIRV